MRILIFAGAGTSVELGVPAMKGMAIEFAAHSEQWNVEPKLVQRALAEHQDVEYLIEILDKVCGAREPLESLSSEDFKLDQFATVRAEIEWFVQHVAERVSAPDARLMWGPALRSVRNHEVTFVTTNYDRAIELAANAEGVQLTDGFGSFADGEMARWIGLQQSKVNPSIVKLHGSTDWYSTSATGEPIKLRHPMPLFGRGTLRLPNNVDLGSALILPSREKLLTRPPYPRLSQAFLNAADACEAAIFIGTSLRDHHIRDAATEIAKSRPAFIVNPEGDNLGIGRAVGVAQSASRFLISTLPSALLAPEPVSALGNAVQDPQHEEPNTLELVRLATSTHEHSERRCQAIEMLDARSVALDGHFVRALVSDKDATVSRYALGLVPASTDRNILITTLQSPHVTDAAFAEELALLQQILSE